MKTRTLDIILNGETIKKDFEIPEFWSDRAATIVASNYAMDDENSAIDIIDRVVNQIGEWGWAQGYFDSTYEPNDDKSLQEFKASLTDILLNQRAAFNSPVWFNCGVKENNNQMSACFIFPVEDNMEDILAHTTREGLVFRAGSGAGVNVSNLRAKGEKLSNKGSASGPLSFMKVWDRNAGSIKSGGKTRRSAKMVCMDVDHPDIMEFINCKRYEEEKMNILMDNGIEYDNAQSTVSFQNTNHSIRVTDEFMKACKDKSNWDLINRGDKKAAKTLPANDILRQAAQAAWEIGDPGIQYDDRMNLDNPVPSLGRIESTNPCSEFSAVNSSSCNLASMNLVKYMSTTQRKSSGWFHGSKFFEDIEVMITAMDILIDAADYPTEEVREITTSTRPLGLGFSNLGALLMRQGVPYDSVDALQIAKYITSRMSTAAYLASIKLAKRLGPFKHFERNKEVCYVIAERVTDGDVNKESIEESGLRNSQLTLLAPTGTISFMMDCDTTGIEPLFALKSIKTLAGGGTMEIIPDCIEYCPNEDAIVTASKVHWKDHINMMAACQPYLNGAISKTVNMSSDCTPEDFYEAYVYGWEKGLKAVAIYRDGSKAMQPLQDMDKEQPKEKEAKPEWAPVRRKLPDTRYGPTHKFNIGGFKGYVNASTYEDGSVGEIFINASKQGSTMQGILDSFATAISLALQYGVPLEKLIEKFKATRFEPNGFTTNEQIRICSSVIDYVFRWLELEFMDSDAEEHDKIEPSSVAPPVMTYDGPSCMACGGLTQRQGTCFVCTTCGETTGCS